MEKKYSQHPDKELASTVSFIQKVIGDYKPQIGIILGTGLSAVAEQMDVHHTISYDKIPHFPVSTVESHSGKLIFGYLQGKSVVAMQGRFHYYEGYSMQQVAWPVRVLKAIGISCLLISNAAGALNPKFKKGSLMLINDHINFLFNNPLIGKNQEEWGPRFPDMSEPYSVELQSVFTKAAQKLNISLQKGVYAAMQGPMLETRVEYAMLRKLGADAVGMSTQPEVTVAKHIELPCAAVSVLTDECD
ncbi:MAG: purine-nucleoside phosphorylase, partial [Salinivirgaceae bacterium]